MLRTYRNNTPSLLGRHSTDYTVHSTDYGGEEIPETEGVLTQQITAQTPDEEPLKITTMTDKPEEKEEEMKMIQVRTGRNFLF
jgi:hypothetical protein